MFSIMKSYESYIPNEDGSLNFNRGENEIWSELYEQQMPIVRPRACREFLIGLERLDLPRHRVPYPIEVSRQLDHWTGWQAEPVPAVIGPKKFFTLLANRQFPCATFIRRREDFSYIKEPDIFHEIYGHCPMLTDEYFAKFVEQYGKFALMCSSLERRYLFRLFWFTVEFGLIKNDRGEKIYGGGILSSIHETQSALNNPDVQYENYDLLKIFRTPYRIDQPQKLYFIIESFEQLYHSLQQDPRKIIQEAARLGDLKPKIPFLDGRGEILEYTN